MTNKYEILTDDNIQVDGHTVYRIKALRSFTTKCGKRVRRGDLGGYIESEGNLSQQGKCWVFDFDKTNYFMYRITAKKPSLCVNRKDAVVYGNAKVTNNAIVSTGARVYGNACVRGNAQIGVYSNIYGNSEIYGNTVINLCDVYDSARVYGTCFIESCKILGSVRLHGKLKIGKLNTAETLVFQGDSNISGEMNLRIVN